jgi:hypothetical protein
MAAPVYANSTIVGSTGLVRMPTADIIGTREFNVGLNYGAPINQNSGISTSEGVLNYNLNLGAFKGLELGVVGGTDPSTSKIREGVFINMKYSLASDDSMYPLLLAIGVENLASFTQTDTYLVATKYFRGNLKLNFGAMFDFPGNKFRPLGMAGISLPVFGNSISLLGEVFAGESLFQADAGVRFHLLPSLALNLSVLHVSNSPISKDSQSVYAGFSWANPF